VCGDALGLAHPLTAEGIVPAALSGRLLGEAIAAGEPASYTERLRAHTIYRDYARVLELRNLISDIPRGDGDAATPSAPPAPAGRASRLASRAIASGFAWMFSGARLPAPRVIDLVLAGARRAKARAHRRS